MALREIFARFGLQFDTGGLDRAQSKITAVRDSLEIMEIGVQKVREAMDFLVGDVVESSVELDRQSARLGVSVQAMQELGFAASESGRELEDMVDAMSTLQERARDALVDPQSDPAEQLRLLGVSATDASGNLKDAETLISEVADGLQGMESQTDRVGASMTLFGDIGRELLPTLQNGSEGLNRLRQDFRDLGGGISEEAIEGSQAFVRQSNRLGAAFLTLRSRLALVFLPTLVRVGGALEEFLGNRRQLEDVIDTLKVMATVLAVRLAPALAMTAIRFVALHQSMIAFVALGAVVFLIVQDIKIALEGGPSLLGQWTDAINDFIEMNRDADGFLGSVARSWERLINLAQRAIGVFARLTGLLPEVPDESEFTNVRGMPAGSQGVAADPRALARIRASRGASRARTGAGGGGAVTQSNTYNVNGVTDPEAVARVVDQRSAAANRRLVEAMEGQAP